jgi:putative ABC transport system ATP-binding protein
LSKNINDSAQLSGGGAGGGASIKLRGTGRDFETPAGSFRALAGIDLEIDAGELVAVVGASGSGKSTLLHLIAGIDRPTSGEVWVAGRPLHDLDETMLTAFRGRHVGIVFQSFQLLPTLTVLENVVVAMDFVAMRPVGERRACALELLDRVAVADQAHKLPATLSGGQQQRVAIARALANDPALVVADEPTGNLDTRTAEQVMALLCSLAELGKTVLVVTHERDVLQRFRRVVELVDGSVLSDTRGAGAGTVTAASEARCTA